MASDILSYNVVQDHEGISIKGYRGLIRASIMYVSDLPNVTKYRSVHHQANK